MATTNLTNLTNADSIFEFIPYLTDQTDGIFGISILLTIYVIAFISLKRYDTKSALIGAGTMTFILCVFMRIMEMIPDRAFWIVLIVCALSIIAPFFEGT